MAFYTPLVFVAAAVVAFVVPWALGLPPLSHVWIQRSLVFLISGCPCALCVAAPVPALSAIAAAANRGMLVKGCDVLEVLGNVTAVAFDKTGTLTQGNFAVNEVLTLRMECPWDSCVAEMKGQPASNGVLHTCPADVMTLAASLESKSSHPLASTVVNSVLGCVTDTVDALGLSAGLHQVKKI